MEPSPPALLLKCPHPECQYGPTGSKVFKKDVFLQNHIKNCHKDKPFSCLGCDEKFAFEWQLKYHRKFCGTDLKCRTCGKRYFKPMSLLMHCKRTLHLLPVKQQFKSVKKSSATSAATVLFVPIIIDRSSLLLNNRPILPKPAQATHTTASLNLNQLPSSKKPLSSQSRKAESAHTTHFTNRRSTDCQTVRKKNRAHSKQNVKSIETQTLASSFDVPQTKKSQLTHEGKLNAKCSSFTQTIFDDFGEQSEPVMRDTFLSTPEESPLETAVQMQYSFGNGIYSDIETQTQASMADFGGDELNTMTEGGDFQISDLELIDIETQTIWNYDRTTQTDRTFSLDADWLNI